MFFYEAFLVALAVIKVLVLDVEDATVDLEDNAVLPLVVVTGTSDAAVMAVQAGNDMLCCTNYEEQIPAVIDAVKDGTITEARIDESVLRILQWKQSLGLLA